MHDRKWCLSSWCVTSLTLVNHNKPDETRLIHPAKTKQTTIYNSYIVTVSDCMFIPESSISPDNGETRFSQYASPRMSLIFHLRQV